LRPIAALLLAVLLVFALTGVAAANAPAPFIRVPGKEGGAFVLQPTALAVEHEELTFRCEVGGCDFEAVYHVLNPTDAREEVLGAFYGIASRRLTATADGRDARRTLTAEQVRAVDDVVAAIDPAMAEPGEKTARMGFGLTVDAHARATLVFAGRVEPATFGTRSEQFGEFAFAPLQVRHLWLGTEARVDTSDEYEYALSPIRGWAGSPSIDVVVRCDRPDLWAEGQQGWAVAREGGARVARRTIPARDASILRFSLVKPGTSLLLGGPLVGLGGRLDAPELRGRLGYEVAYPWWLITSAVVETSFQGRTTLVPLIEAATPDLVFLIPSLGLGVGVPVQLRTGEATRVGVRTQLTVSFPLLSLVLPIDVFPGASTDGGQVALFGQASF
jgi:hypothetical protein